MERMRVVRVVVSIALVAVLVLAVGVFTAACGSSDPFEGTWVDAENTDTGIEISKNDDGTYKVQDPDGGNAWTGTASGDTLSGKLPFDMGGKEPVEVDVTIKVSGDTGTYSMSFDGKSQSVNIKRK